MTPPVVLLTTNLARGGAETQVFLLALALRRRGWPVDVVSLLPPTAFDRELCDAGIPVHTLGMKPGRPSLGALTRLASLLRRIRPLVLHSHMFHANALARAIRIVLPIPRAIGTLHSIAETGRESAAIDARDRIYRLTDPLTDLTVAVSRAVAGRHTAARAVPPHKITVIPNAVDTGLFHPDPAARERVRAELGIAGEFLWLAAGRLHWKKDYATLIAAMERLPDGILCIAGAGPLESELREQARPLGARVRFLGARDDLPALLNAADAFALSSVVEGMPVVLLEAAATGLPCVATKAGGVEEVVVDGETGYLTPAGNAEALAQGMTGLAALSAESRAAMGRSARQRALDSFDMRQVVAQWEAVYLQS